MKNKYRISVVILFILSIFLIHSCKKDKPIPPVIATTTVTAVSYTTATSGGEVTNEGGAPVSARGICWGTTADPTITNSKTTESGGLGSFISNITLLTPNTIYYVRAYATNIAGTGYGSQVSFTTNQVAVPVLTTTTITLITQTTAVSGGNITDDKGGSVSARGVCWSTTQNPTTEVNKTTNGTGTGSFVSNLTGLLGNTNYYVRAYATNSVGTSYGNEISFKTTATLPTLSTTEASPKTLTTATSGGIISSDGGSNITNRGVCLSTSPNPTIEKWSISNFTGTGNFTSSITGLAPNATYYIRAYATNSVGTGYGNTVTLRIPIGETIFNSNLTYGTVTDIDGNVYKTISIGTQTWMAENLRTTKYSNGTDIPFVSQAVWETQTRDSKAYCWYKFISECKELGAYYTWAASMNGALSSNANPSGVQGVCPTGWHLPSSAEWTALSTYLGGMDNAGGKMKETGETHWMSPNHLATNESGFSGIPWGYNTSGGTHTEFTSWGVWWCSTESSTILNAYGWFLFYDRGNNSFMSGPKQSGMAVRCVKD